jgi:hypothetical protein
MRDRHPWTINQLDRWVLLVGARGCTPAQYERWISDTACAQLPLP